MDTEPLTGNRADPETTDTRAGDTVLAGNPLSGKIHRMKRRTGKLFADSPSRKLLAVLASVSLIAYLVAVNAGLFSRVEEWERKHNLSDYHVGEFATLVAVLALTAGLFLLRRYREMREEDAEGTIPPTEPDLSDPRSLHRYRELKTLFHQVETAKKEWERSIDSIGDLVILAGQDGTIHRCNRAFKEFTGLSYEEVLRENLASLLAKFGIQMDGLDLNALNARFHINGKWFVVRSYPYADFESAGFSRVVIIMREAMPRKAADEKIRFVWGH